MSVAYTLRVLIDPLGVAKLVDANQNVVISKQVKAANSSPVIWITEPPMENMLFTWSEIYGMYSSSTPVQAGKVIMVNASLPSVAPGYTYNYKPNGTFDPTGIPNGTNMIALVNFYNKSNPTTFGLTEQYGGSGPILPINAFPMVSNETASITPLAAINIGILSYNLTTSTVLASNWKSTQVVFTPSNPVQTVYFNDQTMSFDLAPC